MILSVRTHVELLISILTGHYWTQCTHLLPCSLFRLSLRLSYTCFSCHVFIWPLSWVISFLRQQNERKSANLEISHDQWTMKYKVQPSSILTVDYKITVYTRKYVNKREIRADSSVSCWFRTEELTLPIIHPSLQLNWNRVLEMEPKKK
jgi:hypothetical protein